MVAAVEKQGLGAAAAVLFFEGQLKANIALVCVVYCRTKVS